MTFEEQSFFGQDGTEIYGYRAFAEGQEPQQQPAIVIVPGNAMLADQLFSFAAYFALQDFTAYLFDYRGYGGSAGDPALQCVDQGLSSRSCLWSLTMSTLIHTYMQCLSGELFP